MKSQRFNNFFQGAAKDFLLEAIRQGLREDGADLTSRAVFTPEEKSSAFIMAKEDSLVGGLPVIPLVLAEAEAWERGPWAWEALAEEGSGVPRGAAVAAIEAPTRLILKAERIMLNFITHISGVANLTARYAARLEGTATRLLDTRKTLPGLRYPEKYGVLIGGGVNHRYSLEDMLMLKDNHIDAAGSIIKAVRMLRAAYSPCPPIEVECRSLAEVKEAVEARPERIMLDNMDALAISEAIRHIPRDIETEVSGGVTLESIGELAGVSPRGPDFISVGRLTHSAPVADFSLKFKKDSK